MKKVTTLIALTIAGSTATFADNGPDFRAAPEAKQAPIVSSPVRTVESKTMGRTALRGKGPKQANISADSQSVSSFKVSDWSSEARIRG